MVSFQLDEIHEQIRQTIRKFAQEEIAPTVVERDINSTYPKEIIKKLGELGFLGMTVSPEWGGSGLDTISYVIAMEEISKVDASVAVIFSVHNSLVNWIFEKYGSNYLKEKYLRRLVTGELIGAYALSEPEAGSDATQIKTSATKFGNHWVLNGTKNWITTGENADIYVVFANTNFELRHKGITCFAIEKGTKGFEPGKKEDKMGLRSSDTTSIGLTNVEVPEENVIGNVGEGFYIAMNGLNGGRIGIAAQALGIAQGAFEAAVRYAKERVTFGKPIIEHQLIQAKLAQMSMKINAARLLIYKAAWLRDNGYDHIQEAAEAKLFASTIANEITREAVQIHGGYGYVREYHVERMMRDAKVTEIYEGTSEIQQLVIAKEIIKKM
ncbi:MAG: acyl-CoA dehydrogenase [Ignavibacteria bacterium]|nr:acyl-CoA dehydrogenase [Ignavibacteria bacterium]